MQEREGMEFLITYGYVETLERLQNFKKEDDTLMLSPSIQLSTHHKSSSLLYVEIIFIEFNHDSNAFYKNQIFYLSDLHINYMPSLLT